MGRQRNPSSRPVYSTESGRLCPGCGLAVAVCACRHRDAPVGGDGIVRLHRETKGRGGKAVTIVRGLPLASDDLKTLATRLKKKCGVGGAVKGGEIEIQGDQRALLAVELETLGYPVKIAGG